MNAEISQKENLLYRLLLALVIIAIAAAPRIAPHPWNFTPVGAMALFSGYAAGLPFFWNTLAGDASYAALFFGAFALAEHFIPIFREPALTAAR